MRPVQPDGYLALPTTGAGHPVLVLHAWWGLNDTVKAFCTRLAEAGFVAFAPDLYGGKIANTIPGAEALSQSLNPEAAKADIAQSVAFLQDYAQQTSDELAVIGFSLGAYFALDLSTTLPGQVGSVVVFYGTGPLDFSNSRARYLGHFAEKDEFEPQESVNDLEEALRHANRPVEFHVYRGTGHWFFEPDRTDAFNPEAAELAWSRTLAFLSDWTHG